MQLNCAKSESMLMRHMGFSDGVDNRLRRTLHTLRKLSEWIRRLLALFNCWKGKGNRQRSVFGAHSARGEAQLQDEL
jgi:hypothetical protein